LEISVNIDNLPVNDRTVQALAEQLEQIQQGLAPLLTAYAWGETANQNRCLLTHHPRWYIQAVLAGEPLDIEQFNAVMMAIDEVAAQYPSHAFSDAFQRELKVISLREVSFTQWSYAAEILGQDREWRDAIYKCHSDRDQSQH
jgi:hypothetical protein